jgi:outer membrane biosynthesis protein TonB
VYRRLATLIAQTGLATGIALLLFLGTLMPGAARASADDCPEGTAPISDVDGGPQCVTLLEGEATPAPTAPPTPAPSPTPTDLPPSTDAPGTAPPEEPVPSAVPESTPAVVVPPSVTEPAETPSETPGPAATPAPAPTPTERTPTPDGLEETSPPTPAIVLPEPPANADTTGVIVPGDGPRLLWAVAAGASSSGLLAAIVAFYLVSVRPFFLARRRPGALD